jgi:beta-glucosidase
MYFLLTDQYDSAGGCNKARTYRNKGTDPMRSASIFASIALSICSLALFPIRAAWADAPKGRPWMDTSLAPEARARLLVAQMTLDEKILQIHMLNTKAHPREVAAIPRLGIPAFKITNGPVGAGPGDFARATPATALPAAIALAASWDPTLADTYGTLIGQEVADLGEQILEGPGVNITRNPQNGRNFEYFGEDPFLSARMAVPEIKAIQNQGVIAEVKHYAANNQETDRKTVNEIIDERTLREIYLPAFEASITEAHADAVMAAYPSVDGHFCSENSHLLQDILRSDWGFQGFVQSDYTGTRSATGAARAGLDLSMRADFYSAGIKTAIANHEIPESLIDQMLIRRYAMMFQLGQFDHPFTPKPIPAKEDGAVARQIADQCVVLLKNDNNILPLDASQIHTIALIGPYASTANTGGGGSSAVKPLYTVLPLDGIKHRAGSNVNVVFEDGRNLKTAVDAAKGADVVLVMLGNKDSEGKDRPNLDLPPNQNALVSAIAAANSHTIVVLKTAGPVLMPWLNSVPAVLQAWYPGEEDGNVVADIVFGDVNPSGKLPMTFPVSLSDIPAHTRQQYPGINLTAVYSEKLEVGYRWYDAQNITPLFPFGFGLSYTTFNVANLTVSAPSPDDSVQVGVDITNTGQRAGADVVQIYAASPVSAGEPPKQLKGFEKVTLQPNQTQHVTLTLDARAFSIWDVNANKWTVAPGDYQILAGDSSRNVPLHAPVTIPAP